MCARIHSGKLIQLSLSQPLLILGSCPWPWEKSQDCDITLRVSSEQTKPRRSDEILCSMKQRDWRRGEDRKDGLEPEKMEQRMKGRREKLSGLEDCLLTPGYCTVLDNSCGVEPIPITRLGFCLSVPLDILAPFPRPILKSQAAPQPTSAPPTDALHFLLFPLALACWVLFALESRPSEV